MIKSLIKNYLKPDKKFSDVSEITVEMLKEEGLKGIILDLDDTLLPSDNKINKDFIDKWLMKIKKEFSIFVVSNNISIEYVKNYCQKFEIPFVARATKPRSKFIEFAISKMNLSKSDVVIIGDRITTDVLAGKIIGIKTFLVKPLTQMPSKIQKIIYSFENYLLKKIEN
jgi:hypothetical protein